MKIIRYKYNTYNVIDRVCNDDSLLFEQTNFNSKNRFGAKKFKCNNGTTLTVNSWEWGNIKEQRNESNIKKNQIRIIRGCKKCGCSFKKLKPYLEWF